MRFHRGRRDGLCSSQEGVGGRGRRGEETHAEDASSNIGGDEGTCVGGGRGGRERRGEGSCDAGRPVIAP